jgi:ATP-dependent helicase/nuclease subunit A
MEYNEPQQRAINTIDKNVAVNAGAGTGKTKVLTERFIKILEDGNLEKDKEVESIVAITFTKKASQEMVYRIRKEIKNNFDSDTKWRRYYRDMEKSNISTIHSFCAKILRENPIEAKIDPNFEVLEDFTSAKLLKESIKEELSKGLDENENIYNMVRIFRTNTLDFLVEDFYQVYNKIRTVGFSFEEVKTKSIEHLDSLKIEEDDLKIIKKTILYLMDKLAKSSKLVKLKDNPIWINFNNGDYKEEDLPEILEYLYKNMGTSCKEPDKMGLLSLTLEKAMLGSEMANLWIYNTTLDLLIDIDKNYTLRKKKIRSLDYDDLQIIVLNLLDNEVIKKKYQERYRYIMIDEFQDTNELQKNIFYKLSTENNTLDKSNLFVVGDPKQSIYGFRGADVDVFYNVIEDIKDRSKEETITLEKNYRTVGTVLKFINDIFSKLMLNRYDPLSEFHKSENEIDVEILENPDLIVPEGHSESEYSRHYEAELIAKRIKELVLSGKFKYGDFAMLFRATTRNHIYEEALKNFNIPYYNSGGKRYFLQQEILDLINALKSISNPLDTISTIGFLRSPMIGLKDNSIYWILRNRKTTVYESMKDIVGFEEIDEMEREKIKEAIILFDDLYQIRDFYGLSKLLHELIDKTSFIESLLLKESGKQALANVYKFKEIVREYEKSNRPTLVDFMDYLEEAKNRDESQGKIESENADVVKLLTIHKSKGLQFPVVIIPEMSTGSRSFHPNILFNKDIGIGIKLENGKALHSSIKEDLDKKDKEEMERILYVAMTRAEKTLILGNQGKSQGFKKLILDIIDPLECITISNIPIDMEGYQSVRNINEELVNHKESVDLQLPLLYSSPNYNKKIIERYSISQYLTFVDCNRKFHMDYYRKISGMINLEKLDRDLDENLDEDIEENYSLSPIVKGNLVHKFCEHYKLGVDKIVLTEKICKSFGILYTDEIQNELNPYIENYLDHYREDYDKVYIEKEFYLKIDDSFITGIIDRINIKDNVAEIVDFKTNIVKNKKSLINQYTPQLQLYTYVVKEIMGINVDRARILFLANGHYEDIKIDDSALEKNIYNIKEFIDFVSNHSDLLDYKKSYRCSDYCKHKSICDLE